MRVALPVLDAPEREQARQHVLINDLRALPAEAMWVEFKENNAGPEMIGKLISALSNAARLADQHFAYVVWGVRDGDHAITGTTFEPSRLGIAEGDASQALGVIKLALTEGLIRPGDPERPRAGYVPYWA